MPFTTPIDLEVTASEQADWCDLPGFHSGHGATETVSRRGADGSRPDDAGIPSVLTAMRRRAPWIHDSLRAAWDGPALLPEGYWPRHTSVAALPMALLPNLERDGTGALRWGDVAAGAAKTMPDYDWNMCVPRALQGARCKRLRSFLAGRLCAEEAIRRSIAGSQPPRQPGAPDLSVCGVGMGPRGAPIWPSPDGRRLIGSITHSHQWALAVVCPGALIRCIGIDCEEVMDAHTHAAVLQLCLTSEEQRRLPALSVDAALATVVYSAKEALYKAIWPIVERYVDFTEVEVSALDLHNGTLAFDSSCDQLSVLLRRPWCHRFFLESGRVHAISVLPVDESPDSLVVCSAGDRVARRHANPRATSVASGRNSSQ